MFLVLTPKLSPRSIKTMNFYVTWQTSSRIPLREMVGPFMIWEAALREVDFVSTDPRICVTDIDIEIVEESVHG